MFLQLRYLFGALGGQPRTFSRSGLGRVRTVLYSHVVAILLCAAFSLSDTDLLQIPKPIEMLFYVRAIQFPLMMTWLACPILMCIAASQLHGRSRGFRMGIVVFDAFLSLFQLWVMLPLVQ